MAAPAIGPSTAVQGPRPIVVEPRRTQNSVKHHEDGDHRREHGGLNPMASRGPGKYATPHPLRSKAGGRSYGHD